MKTNNTTEVQTNSISKSTEVSTTQPKTIKFVFSPRKIKERENIMNKALNKFCAEHGVRTTMVVPKGTTKIIRWQNEFLFINANSEIICGSPELAQFMCSYVLPTLKWPFINYSSEFNEATKRLGNFYGNMMFSRSCDETVTIGIKPWENNFYGYLPFYDYGVPVSIWFDADNPNNVKMSNSIVGITSYTRFNATQFMINRNYCFATPVTGYQVPYGSSAYQMYDNKEWDVFEESPEYEEYKHEIEEYDKQDQKCDSDSAIEDKSDTEVKAITTEESGE